VTLDWDGSCNAQDGDYAVYQGAIGDFTSHESLLCSTGGATTQTLTPGSGSVYFLVVPNNGTNEGSYGVRTGGTQRTPATAGCLPQSFESCL